MTINKYLQQATGAFQAIGSGDIATISTTSITFTSTTVYPLYNVSAQTNANSTSTTVNYTAVPNCSLPASLAGSGIYLVMGYASFINTAGAQLWRLQLTDGTTADGLASSLAVSLAYTAGAGLYGTQSLFAVATSPSSQISLQYAPNSAAATGIQYTVNGGCGITAVRIG